MRQKEVFLFLAMSFDSLNFCKVLHNPHPLLPLVLKIVLFRTVAVEAVAALHTGEVLEAAKDFGGVEKERS
jgi:hypothetical protein